MRLGAFFHTMFSFISLNLLNSHEKRELFPFDEYEKLRAKWLSQGLGHIRWVLIPDLLLPAM